ncbi:MAG TPA: hypothetical protein PKY73_08270, partial [Hyphomonas sp.]|nr:hypothetical protein [Hyphomonas sp.]
EIVDAVRSDAEATTPAGTAAPPLQEGDPLFDFMVERGIIDPATGLATGAGPEGAGETSGPFGGLSPDARDSANAFYEGLLDAFENPGRTFPTPLTEDDLKPWMRIENGALVVEPGQTHPGIATELPDVEGNEPGPLQLAALEPADLPGAGTRSDAGFGLGYSLNLRASVLGTYVHGLFASEMSTLIPQSGTMLVANRTGYRYIDFIVGRHIFELKPITWQFNETSRRSADTQVGDYVDAMNNNVGRLAFFGYQAPDVPRPYIPGTSDLILRPNTPDGGMRLNSVVYDGKDFVSITLYPDYRERAGQRTGLIFYQLEPIARTPELEARLEQARQQNLLGRYGGIGFTTIDTSGPPPDNLPTSSSIQGFFDAVRPRQRIEDPMAPFEGRPPARTQPPATTPFFLPGTPIRVPGAPVPVTPPPRP